MIKRISLLALLVIGLSSTAQTKKTFTPADIDSLETALKIQKDTSHIKTMLNISQAYSSKDPAKAIDFAQKASEKAKKIGYKKGELKGYNNLGGIYLRLSDFKTAKRYIDTSMLLAIKWKDIDILIRCHQNNGTMYYYQQNYDSAITGYTTALDLSLKQLRDTTTIAKLYNNIAACYQLSGKFSKSVEYYLKSLKLNETINDTEGIIMASGNIGVVYFRMKEYIQAEKYLLAGLKMAQKAQNKFQISAIYLNLGVVYKDTKQFEKAEEQLLKALEVKKEIGDKNGEGMVLVNIGEMASDEGDFEKAINYFTQAEKIAIEIKNPQIELYTYTCLANVYSRRKDYSNASKKYDQAIGIAEKLNLKPDLIDIYRAYSEASAKDGRFEKAYNYHVKFFNLKDSIFSADNNKMIAEMNTKYDSEKKQSQIELLNKEKEKQAAISASESKRQKIIIGSVTAGLLLVLVFALFIFKSYKEKQKANVEILAQKTIIEERNREVHDSITYAKRIQTAILPSEKVVKDALPDSFVLFKPKDIVSGDFYWIEKRGDTVFYAAVDCTGHGVPGAMVSVVGHNALNRAIKEFGLTEPAAILDKLNELVEETFEKSEAEVKDGMDISLCSLDIRTNTLKWAGANNPLWIISKGELLETKADKQPIGKFDFRKPFTEHTFHLQKGDTVYVFTDGYADQFGGPQGKKFKYQQLKTLVHSFQQESMEKQKTALDQSFESWRGQLEQIDDVCIIGVRV